MKNLFFELLDVDKVKKAIANTPKDEVCILLPHYSINVQMAYRDAEDPEQIDWDYDEFCEAIGYQIEVSDYDDLIVDVHGIAE